MRVLLFGFAHHLRLSRLAKGHRLEGVRRGPVRRLAALRAFLPLSEPTREIGLEAFPYVSPRQAGAMAQILWDRIAAADAVAVWSGQRDFALAAVRIAQAQGKPIVFVENGFLPSTYQIDLEGINFESSLARLTAEELRSMPISDDAFRAPIHFRQRPLGRDTGAESAPPVAENLPAGYVLFAAQVHDDSQIVRFSPEFPTVEAAIRYTAEECAALRRSLVIKLHPSDHGRVDYGPLMAALPQVRFLEEADNAALIEGCFAFVTVNSSMALQAIHAGKPVAVLGDAAYALPGIATRIRPPARLRDMLANPEIDEDLRRRYLAFLAGIALVPCRARVPSDAELAAVVRRMVELLGPNATNREPRSS